MINKISIFAPAGLLIIVFHLCAIAGPGLSLKQGVVALGFSTGLLNDVEKRMLRDTLTRKLYQNRYKIIPIMELEEHLAGIPEKKRNALSRKQIRALVKKTGFAYALSGRLTADHYTRNGKGIQLNKTYTCTLLIFNSSENSFTVKKFSIKGEKDLYDFFGRLSDTIILLLDRYITAGKTDLSP